MNLSTTYMGFELPHPLVPGAGPLAENLDTVRRLEDAGAPMIILHSLFEEQITSEQVAVTRSLEVPRDSYAEALSYLPEPDEFALGPDDYLEQIGRIKQVVSVPVVASLNGSTAGGWLSYARLIEQAGADGLELNLYEVAADPFETGEQIEDRSLHVVGVVREAVAIPVAVKLSPFYSSTANFARKLDNLGVNALVLFNRFYQPDIDIEQLEVVRVNLSSPAELPLRLRWLAILSGRLRASLAATGGIHSPLDAVKAVMAGAHAVQMVSALLQRGPAYLKQMRDHLARWLEEHAYESLRQMQGSMSLQRCGNPRAYERANYMKVLQSWQLEGG
ncbi:MAG TPA: dihydroorotate dehydrogenase-like protein [Gemmataceae bacterium]|nr:dihydroorotate dehydrogenase-like protein [Gemmataceae bacterium]